MRGPATLSGDLWVFGYGSLMWRPGFPHLEVREGLLEGYQRSFCVYSHYWRGTKARPGLVLGLVPGGQCRGLVFRVEAARRVEVMDYLTDRELSAYAYEAQTLPVLTSQGDVRACVFIAALAHDNFAGDVGIGQAAAIIMDAEGKAGLNRDYLINTLRELNGRGFGEPHLQALLHEVERQTGVINQGDGI